MKVEKNFKKGMFAALSVMFYLLTVIGGSVAFADCGMWLCPVPQSPNTPPVTGAGGTTMCYEQLVDENGQIGPRQEVECDSDSGWSVIL